MSALAKGLSLTLSAGGLVCLATAAVTVGWREGLAMALDLWVAAGLLGLGTDLGWEGIAAAAGIIAVRQIVSTGLRRPAYCQAAEEMDAL